MDKCLMCFENPADFEEVICSQCKERIDITDIRDEIKARTEEAVENENTNGLGV